MRRLLAESAFFCGTHATPVGLLKQTDTPSMPPDRLAELRRQRALVAQHLAWIDAELTAAGAGQAPSPVVEPVPAASAAPSAEPPPQPPAAVPAPAAPQADPGIALANTRADEIIEKYRATEALDPQAARRGCLTLFGAAFALAGFVLLAIYYFRYAKN